MKLQLVAAVSIVVCLVGCGQSRRSTASTAAEDAAVASASDARPRAEAEPSDAEPSVTASPGAADSGMHDSAGHDSGSHDSAANDSDAHDSGPTDSGANDERGPDAAPPMSADPQLVPDPFAAEPESAGPHIAIDFPPADARTDQSRLRVRGRVFAAQGGTLSSNGTNIPIDGSGGWTTTVALAPGKNAVKFELALGSEHFEAVRNVRSEPTLRRPAALAIDAASNRAYVADRDSLQSVDLDSGERRLISGASRGNGPALSRATALAIDVARKRAFIGAPGPALFIVDLETGDRSSPPLTSSDYTDEILALNVAPDGRVLVTRRSLAWFDPASGRLTQLNPQPSLSLPEYDPTAPSPTTIRYATWSSGPDQALIAVCGTSFSLFSVNLTTGESSVVSDAKRGSGMLPLSVTSMVLEPSGDVAYLANSNSEIVRIDLRTGDRAIVSERSNRGNGPFSRDLGRLIFDGERHRLFAMFEEGLLEVQLDSGDRTVITSNHTGAWQSLEHVHNLWSTPAGNHVLSVVGGGDAFTLLAFDLRNGMERVVAKGLPGDKLALDTSTSPPRAWVLERYVPILWGVRLNDGERTIDLTQGDGFGDPLRDPQAVLFDSSVDAKHAYVVDGRSRSDPAPAPVGAPYPSYVLVRVDLMSGDRVIVSDDMTGSGPNGPMGFPVLDVKRKRVIAVAPVGLLAIDLQTGQRSRLAELTVEDSYNTSVAIDADGDRLLIASREHGLIGFDLESGTRSQLSPAGVHSAAGPELDFVAGLTAVPHRRLAVLLCYNVLIVVDLTTGERVIIS